MSRWLVRAVHVAGVVVWPVAYVGLKVWSRFGRQQRARMVLWNEREEVLLVKGVIGHRQWSLPGGGINRGEAPMAGALREVREELGISIPQVATKEVTFLSRTDADGYAYDAHIFTARIRRDQLQEHAIDPYEIRAAQWFSIDALPAGVSGVTRECIVRSKSVDFA